jgi:uncharacterized protein (DUF885 family)
MKDSLFPKFSAPHVLSSHPMQPLVQFDHLASEYFESSYRASPTAATELGLHNYDDQLDDLSARALRAYASQIKRYRAKFEAFDPAELAEGAATDRVLILAEIDGTLLSLETIRDWERDPSFYVTTPLFSIFLLASRNFAPIHERVHNLTARLEQLPDLLAAGRANLRHPPRVLTEVAIEETEGAIEFCSTLIPQISRDLPKTPRAFVRASSRASRALYEYLDFLRDELMLVSTGDLGIGPRSFEEKLRIEHMLPYSLNEVLGMGQRVFEETQLELTKWARRIDPNKGWREISDAARRDYPSRSRLLYVYRKEVARLRRFIREKDLVTLPEDDCDVVETPPFDRALNNYAAYVGPGPFEANQRGQFWVTPVDPHAPHAAQVEQLEEHCNYLYPITAAHEAYPGHHVQLVRANQVGSRWRKHFSSSLFAEGWALYCEELVGEEGYYEEPRMKLFQLKDRLWRAARVMMEIGLHCYAMPLDEAARFLVDKVGMTPTAARAETRRYAAEPTQPLSYLIGELEVFKLREKFSRLNLREFHDLLLSSGTIPFALVEKEMEAKLISGRATDGGRQ